MGHNLKWRRLSDFTSRQANIAAECGYCRRRVTLDAKKLAYWASIHLWNDALENVAGHMYCIKCRRRPSRLRPSRQEQNHMAFFPENEVEWRKLVDRLRG